MFEKVSIITSEVISSRGIRNVFKLCCDLVSYYRSHVKDDEDSVDDAYDDDEQELRPIDVNEPQINNYGSASQPVPSTIEPALTNESNADEDGSEDNTPIHSNPCSFCLKLLCIRLCVKPCSTNVQHTRQQHICNRIYFQKRLTEDLKVISGHCYLLISILQLFAGVIVLVTFIFAELVLARLVFRQTNVMDVNSLLALLPTVVFSVFTWFGRGLIFDVREDLKELNIPYFSKKETVEEKILREITALRILQGGQRLKRVKRKK